MTRQNPYEYMRPVGWVDEVVEDEGGITVKGHTQPDGGEPPILAEGGWCAPLSALHDLPRIAVPRGDVVYEYQSEPLPSPSRRVRFRAWRRRVRYRFRSALRAWRHWDDDEEGW